MMKLSDFSKRLVLSTLVLLSCLFIPCSCGNNEPDWFIGYYLSVDSQIRLSLSEDDENQGTMPDRTVDIVSNVIRRMKAALQEAYPEDNLKGDDSAALAACNNIYMAYKHAYSEYEGNTVVVVKLYRVKKDNDVVKESTPLTVYHFGALPITVVPIDF